MQSTLPKIATVILAISAVAFMGMSVAAYFGRPEPLAEMQSPEIADYKFEVSGDGKSWTITPSVGEDRAPKTKSNAYEALLEAYNHKAGRMSSAATEQTGLATTLRDTLNQVAAEQQEDTAAMQRRLQGLTAQVGQFDSTWLQKSEQLQKMSVDSRAIRDETGQRREDVIRLQSELEELRTDTFRLEQLRRTLTDRLLRLQLENQTIQQRLQQLEGQVQS
ncbi:MAG: hypothetical protein R3C49_26035 [Planctomycetaceae bacterium]